ncbi:MAG TPA: metal-dependent hydrolase [Candidatus Eisenbacteria bacterium]|nr:metal-dependent hydrolase [Candidatus Eisenbacteria bacterium]
MPTPLSHTAVPIAARVFFGERFISNRLLWTGVAGSILPDLDVVAFTLGIPYDHPLGHRGFTHSIFFAAVVALLAATCFRKLQASFAIAFWFLFLSIASHGVLDAFTSGGKGIAFLWPFYDTRYFARFRPIIVAPIEPSLFFSMRGVYVLYSELLWIWIPGFLAVLPAALWRRRRP